MRMTLSVTESGSRGEERRSLPLLDSQPGLEHSHLVLDRRTFLRLAGFTLGSVAVAGCQRAPVQEAVPYLVPPEGIVPGRTYQYATNCSGCSAGCGVLSQNRDGRPIKLEAEPSDRRPLFDTAN